MKIAVLLLGAILIHDVSTASGLSCDQQILANLTTDDRRPRGEYENDLSRLLSEAIYEGPAANQILAAMSARPGFGTQTHRFPGSFFPKIDLLQEWSVRSTHSG